MESKRLYVEPKRWYAIKRGYKTGIYNDRWSVVKKYVDYYSGAIFKGFDVYHEAYDYMHNGEELPPPVKQAQPIKQKSKPNVKKVVKKTAPVVAKKTIKPVIKKVKIVKPIKVVKKTTIKKTPVAKKSTIVKSSKPIKTSLPKKLVRPLVVKPQPSKQPTLIAKPISNPVNNDICQMYVDGSYNDKYPNVASYAFVPIKNNQVLSVGNGIIEDITKICKNEKSNNIVGEVYSVLNGLKWAIDQKIKYVQIFYDYQGLSSWINDGWKTNTNIAKLYVEQYKKLVDKSKIKVEFCKVKSHSNNAYNDFADLSAKNALNLWIQKTYNK